MHIELETEDMKWERLFKERLDKIQHRKEVDKNEY